jgi:hypothetical protein
MSVAKATQPYPGNINIVALLGLCPYIYSVYNNPYNLHSKSVLVFGTLFHTNCNNRLLKWLDITMAISTFIYVLYCSMFIEDGPFYYIIAGIIGITFVSNQLIFDTPYKNYVHVLLITWPGWYCIHHFENKGALSQPVKNFGIE